MIKQEGDTTNNDMLTRAFRDFDQAATVLQQSYDALTTRLQQMDLELAQTNASLREHLRETEEMRAHSPARPRSACRRAANQAPPDVMPTRCVWGASSARTLSRMAAYRSWASGGRLGS